MASFLSTVKPFLPKQYAGQLDSLDPTLLDAILRFSTGGPCPSDADATTHTQWSKQQQPAVAALERLKSTFNHKRTRDDDDTTGQPDLKRVRSSSDVPQDDKPLYTLHSISVSTPVRKKVNITIHKSSIRFNNVVTNETETSIPISLLKRAFILPTTGKTKPHWTVLIMSFDTPFPTGKAAVGVNKEDQPQIMFGVDDEPPPFFTIDHSVSDEPTSHPKGTSILPFLKQFLSHLPFDPLIPTTEVFRSTVMKGTGGDGVAGVTGHLNAKPGTLWFLSEGILWDAKPIEFWALSDIVGGRSGGKGQVDVDLGGAEGVRTISPTGRDCSVHITRKVVVASADGEEEGGEEEEVHVEKDIRSVDGREQDGIARWVKKHKHLFGVAPVVDETGMTVGAKVAQAEEDGSDEDDSDFEGSSSDGGSPTSDSDEESEDDGGGASGDDARSEDLGSGSEASDEEEDEEDGEAEAEGEVEVEEGDEADDEEEEELDPAHHPLLQPGAMPRMSRAAVNAVIEMVQDDLMGGGTSLERRAANDAGESGDEEEDELED
ncbi:hypothetical protein BXZ70DRAFT_922388 [Cristinia sonorae]|uniref:Histone chaperone RTT106/FACT complex subunit SPT16-like middle domain-containing protein n=1 Tax=Cristinia sonorae TaxID=1940300 RepID=A0A8K0UVY5_9AGAR|nr:hypothetical protein BXZ70DRAFT_922388 [Cristinia sonorae]